MIYNEEQLGELLSQALQTVIGRVDLYTEALKCSLDEELAHEWRSCLEQAGDHRRTLCDLFERIGLDAETESASRSAGRHIGDSLVQATRMARQSGSDAIAKKTAAECIVLAETRDRANWELLAEVARRCSGPMADLLCDAVAESFLHDGHKLWRTKAFLRGLWLRSLGLPVLPQVTMDDEFDELRPVHDATGATLPAEPSH